MANDILKTVIVEDSETQRTILCKLVEKHRNLSLIGDYHNGIVALNAIRTNEVDLILLDVEMPIVNGFDLVESLESPPPIILISDKREYALKAFDYNIIDYLIKPIAQQRFNTAIQRAITEHKQKLHIKENDLFIYVNDNLQKKKLFIDKIKWVEALGDYIKLVTDESNFLVLSTMKAFMVKLPENQFVRIHKSYIANTNRIENWCSTNVVIDGTQLPMSRTRKDDLEHLLAPRCLTDPS